MTRLDEIRARLEAASKWDPIPIRSMILQHPDSGPTHASPEEIALCVSARDDLGYLLARVGRLEGVLRQCDAALTDLVKQIPEADLADWRLDQGEAASLNAQAALAAAEERGRRREE